MERRGRAAARRATRGKRIFSILFFILFRPGGAKEIPEPTKGHLCPAPTPGFSCILSSRPSTASRGSSGIEDHVHMYLRWRPDESVSNLMRTAKARSSKWVHDTFPALGPFAWQEGYSVFSVSKSQEDAVKKYIEGQAAHHKKEDFRSELLRMLRAHEVEFDERYVFD
ncbi:MAG: transposase [Planctomycetota bacterium]|nr:transposase [Planctomycetota bacterium]